MPFLRCADVHAKSDHVQTTIYRCNNRRRFLPAYPVRHLHRLHCDVFKSRIAHQLRCPLYCRVKLRSAAIPIANVIAEIGECCIPIAIDLCCSENTCSESAVMFRQ